MARPAIELVTADIAGFVHDPMGFVRYAFPWGEPGTGLAAETGPRLWQKQVLREIGQRVARGASVGEAVQIAVASGHGIGKSALVAWVILWALSTREQTRGVVTANTEGQLRTKTWPEVRKWHALSINADWFTCAATSIHATGKNEKTWRIDAIPWSESNTEAFAGLHNKGSRILVVFDEASAISDKIWEVTEGALTDEGTEIIWAAFGNPTRNAGRFRECFGRYAHRWEHRQIDSRAVDGTNKIQIQKWITDYGDDSDFVRVRVKGEFPRAGSMQFISSEMIAAAQIAEAESWPSDPAVMGVDVARFGDDESGIRVRRGRDARTWEPIYLRGLDTMALVGRVVSEHARHRAMGMPIAMTFVDETGLGAGVVDRLRQLGVQVIGVNNGSRPDQIAVEGENVANKAAEQWAMMRAWLRTGGAIDNDLDLKAQLEGREYGYNQHNAIVLERKDDMKKRGLSSPDRADSLALTFAYPVASIPGGHQAGQWDTGGAGDVVGDFDPYR